MGLLKGVVSDERWSGAEEAQREFEMVKGK
jgi:hypothetical protein